ncbi:PREDICTED: HMG box transcription factor BBX-like isoform X2 [Eufriesea mexicana]|uniref:HMG box transcription factor BBX-like isoform X2 n=1 Tax=Eufriesea mexicana TaxID=516756 RepID=UPI00083C587D|nr:PREDICTED: HMG box transcription factor BBX-like isoform X2 [Eufriesea mexicana]XP_017758427.1 PREDICTED: HMG box transcription factor BBX-like isoform X2 [Eufriesea mexicana]
MAANEQQRKEPRELREPAHHARRPMNAFLIFCKRHRGSVRSGFPHLENRAVTRVLGEWWATLHPDQKRSYTNLAQEYKDAFLNANPDFKWYKLPAPPLRTLNTRPTNKKAETSSNEQPVENVKSENKSSDYLKSDKRDGQSIQPGKLADESQIGGLSSLFTPQKTQVTDEQITINGSVIENDVPKPPKKRYSDIPFSSDTKRECKADLFDVKKRKKSESNNNVHQYDAEDEKTEINNFLATNISTDESNFRSERTCKGLRYQKFLAEQMKNVGVSGQQPKRRRQAGSRSDGQTNERRNSISSNVSEKTDSLSSEGGNSSRGELEHLVESAEGNLEASKPEETETEGTEEQVDFGPWTARKRFRAEDFNLEKKIEALPSLSLEEFQEKKKQQRTKKKKIIQKLTSTSNNKRYQNNFDTNDQTNNQNISKICQTERENSEDTEKLLVGSQKRKARKQSITRNAAAINDLKQVEIEESEKSWCASPDLEALVCLAAVAANRTKLTKNNT